MGVLDPVTASVDELSMNSTRLGPGRRVTQEQWNLRPLKKRVRPRKVHNEAPIIGEVKGGWLGNVKTVLPAVRKAVENMKFEPAGIPL